MLSDRLKNKIYASVSILVLAFAAVSFILVVNFLVEVNRLVFNIDNKDSINESSAVFDSGAYVQIKNEIEKLENNN